MKKNASKKDWQRPKLVVLVRGRPEEMVILSGCKVTSGDSNAAGMADGCMSQQEPEFPCSTPCSASPDN